ncbi:2-phospho-L-lactate transferase [uncultured Ilumatobacter sp.]|uniref:2-phospho-L-lactate transferase n=1 Tax=uncultured Ilumatobacter sp. TaxID=879968 RepID=UPI00374FBF6D|tara:strand:+ start:349 stop:1371 length:1023 start_codon:yes stop_codon:yes gene_type:complete
MTTEQPTGQPTEQPTEQPTGPTSPTVTVVSGGVGAARFLSGLRDAIDPTQITAVVNTGDDTVLHGLSISPDLDTITYTLAGATDPVRGWGLVDETWTAMGALERYEAVRPAGSAAATRWFNLGDQDLATHFYRTARLAEGASLTEVTEEIQAAWGLPIRLLPMSDDRRTTIVTTADHGDVSFQDYFVRLRHDVVTTAVRFQGPAALTQAARSALVDADIVVIAPSNPLVSIAPIRSLDGVDDLLGARRDSVVAVSPIVGGEALKGPAARMLTELGHEASVVGVARLYASIATALVIDPVDAHLADAIVAQGMECIVTPSIMSSPEIARELAATTLNAVHN